MALNRTIIQLALRNFSRSAIRRSEEVTEVTRPKFKRLKEIQAKYSVDDGVPSYLKGGLKDKIFYQATLLLTFVGLCMSADLCYRLAVGKRD